MKVKELISKLKEVDPEMEVYCTSASGVYEYGKAHTAKSGFITLGDGDGATGDEAKEDLVFIIDEQ